VAVPKQLKVTGAASLGPFAENCGTVPTGECGASLNFTQTVQADRVFSRAINSPAAFVDLLDAAFTNVRYVLLRVRAGTFTVRVTSPAGVDQFFTLSDLLVVSNPSSGSEWTAIAVQGTGDIEVMLAGD
jgi:hypothetical protein